MHLSRIFYLFAAMAAAVIQAYTFTLPARWTSFPGLSTLNSLLPFTYNLTTDRTGLGSITLTIKQRTRRDVRDTSERESKILNLLANIDTTNSALFDMTRWDLTGPGVTLGAVAALAGTMWGVIGKARKYIKENETMHGNPPPWPGHRDDSRQPYGPSMYLPQPVPAPPSYPSGYAMMPGPPEAPPSYSGYGQQPAPTRRPEKAKPFKGISKGMDNFSKGMENLFEASLDLKGFNAMKAMQGVVKVPKFKGFKRGHKGSKSKGQQKGKQSFYPFYPPAMGNPPQYDPAPSYYPPPPASYNPPPPPPSYNPPPPPPSYNPPPPPSSYQPAPPPPPMPNYGPAPAPTTPQPMPTYPPAPLPTYPPAPLPTYGPAPPPAPATYAPAPTYPPAPVPYQPPPAVQPTYSPAPTYGPAPPAPNQVQPPAPAPYRAPSFPALSPSWMDPVVVAPWDSNPSIPDPAFTIIPPPNNLVQAPAQDHNDDDVPAPSSVVAPPFRRDPAGPSFKPSAVDPLPFVPSQYLEGSSDPGRSVDFLPRLPPPFWARARFPARLPTATPPEDTETSTVSSSTAPAAPLESSPEPIDMPTTSEVPSSEILPIILGNLTLPEDSSSSVTPEVDQNNTTSSTVAP